MADLTRADELVQAIDRDAAFRSEVQEAPTMEAKRAVLDARGFADVGLEDMKAWVESKGGQLIMLDGGRELTDEELAAVAGGLTSAEIGAAVGGGIGAVAVGAAIGFAAAYAAGVA